MFLIVLVFANNNIVVLGFLLAATVFELNVCNLIFLVYFQVFVILKFLKWNLNLIQFYFSSWKWLQYFF